MCAISPEQKFLCVREDLGAQVVLLPWLLSFLEVVGPTLTRCGNNESVATLDRQGTGESNGSSGTTNLVYFIVFPYHFLKAGRRHFILPPVKAVFYPSALCWGRRAPQPSTDLQSIRAVGCDLNELNKAKLWVFVNPEADIVGS